MRELVWLLCLLCESSAFGILVQTSTSSSLLRTTNLRRSSHISLRLVTDTSTSDTSQGSDGKPVGTPSPNFPVLAATAFTVLTTAYHAPAFAQFISQWQAIAAAGVEGDDLTAPLSFWTFFAVTHPLMKPAVAIGEVLHSSPGPVLGDIVPASFVLLNLIVIVALSLSPQVHALHSPADLLHFSPLARITLGAVAHLACDRSARLVHQLRRVWARGQLQPC